MNLSSTLRRMRWAIAIALGGAASVVHAGPCQEEHGREMDRIKAGHKQELKSCDSAESAPCIKKANAKKAAGIKAANKKQIECNNREQGYPQPPGGSTAPPGGGGPAPM